MARASQSSKRVLANPSAIRIAVYCFLSSCSVALVSLTLQWLIYKDWLHDVGPVRLVGTVLAALTTFFLVWHWQEGIRQRRVDTQRRLQIIAQMNDRIRNALQAIECITYIEDKSTVAVRQAVDTIDDALRGVVTDIQSTTPRREPNQHRRSMSRATG